VSVSAQNQHPERGAAIEQRCRDDRR
jgi:hypothetical protein